jgi:hypothetical protein
MQALEKYFFIKIRYIICTFLMYVIFVLLIACCRTV